MITYDRSLVEPPDDRGIEARIAKLEVTVAYIRRDVDGLQAAQCEANAIFSKFAAGVTREFRLVRSEMASHLKWMLAAYGGGVVLVLGAFGGGFIYLLDRTAG